MRFRILLSAIMLLLAMTGEASSEPRRVLLLHSFGPYFAPWSEIARPLREELQGQSKEPVDIFEASLATARYAGGEEEPFINYLRALFLKRRLDLVIALGAPAANFVQGHRQQLFPSTPALYTGLDQRRVRLNALTANDAVVTVSLDLAGAVENILRVFPETTGIAVVIGNSSTEKFWLEQMHTAFQPFEDRVTFTWFNELSFDEMLKRAGALPPRSAIYFAELSVDAAGAAYEETKALAALHAVANAPIFASLDAYFGQGIVGGPLAASADMGRKAASVAVRILSGEPPGGIKMTPIESGAPKFDWRELRRWNISEARLPAGSEVYFRAPGMWEQYKLQVTGGVAALLLQTAIISWLLVERRRRYFAQAEAGSRRREVIRLNRVTTANVLSSSIAHELNQPLGAILSNTEAAQILLKANPPDLTQIGEILADIVRDEQRASEIIIGLRNLLNNRAETDLRSVDLNDTVRAVVKIVSPELERRGVVLRTVLAPEALPVRSDPIHLQQVMINLVMNGMDAMDGAPRPHNLTVRTRQNAEADGVEVRISDSGKGIPNDKLASIFDAFVTTKPQGTGLGLPIARTIVESYGGDIWAENRQRGAVFSFRLPLAKTQAG
jgi:signal transduction histidine kinase